VLSLGSLQQWNSVGKRIRVLHFSFANRFTFEPAFISSSLQEAGTGFVLKNAVSTLGSKRAFPKKYVVTSAAAG